MNTPTQPGIPGLPPPDRRRELRAQLDIAERDAKEAARAKRAAADELAELLAEYLVAADNTPARVRGVARAYCTADAANLAAKADAGRIAADLAAEMRRTEGGAE